MARPRKLWPRKPWPRRHAARLPISPKVRCCVRRADSRRPFPNTRRSIAFNRNWLHAISALGECKLYTGSTEEAILLQEQAIRLSPRDPLVGAFYQRIGIAHLLQSRTDEAIPWFEKARGANPGHPGAHAWLASAYALKGDTERAAAELAEARRLNS